VNFDLDWIFSSFNKRVSNRIGEFYKANLVWTWPLILLLLIISNHIMTNNHTHPKLLKVLVPSKIIYAFFNLFSFINVVLNTNTLENHLICCQCACFISQNIINYSKLFDYRSIEYSAVFICFLIVHFTIER
jgi:hypothetical protein